jgi:murein DD-endopeptidase MepM/ murein hydrolase activator NlpD
MKIDMTMRLGQAVAAVAVVLAVGCSGTRAETVLLHVDLRARAVAPGEPVRIVVASPEPLSSLAGSFLGEEIAMIRTGQEGEGPAEERWSGWAMVDLDHPAGPALIEVSGSTPDGRAATGRLETAVETKSFPTEELTVASKFVSPPPEVQERLARERRKLSAIYARRSAYGPPPEPFARPVPGDPTSVFGTRRLFNGEPRSPHPGLDLRAGSGEPVGAAGSGTVVLAEEFYYSGNLVILDHGGGLFTLYAHLSEIGVREGQRVAKGDTVGLVGATGRVTGPHLHWGAKIGNRPFDPMALVDQALFR